ncbi:protein jagged-1-like [Tropilaelaps mercedesae]|uniref:Protein jagged-1-like n=1 Tax=Tropilaelaps mercedesae TaxID=418985 RepID=A0A1V9Y1K2_9ACAR|nr:protein jagged-1-like [Tropilaelaps mercedesae]
MRQYLVVAVTIEYLGLHERVGDQEADADGLFDTATVVYGIRVRCAADHYAKGKPLTCECERNWGGHLCDQDLDVCGRTFPCKNGGICRNIAANEYRCSCAKGFSGRNCELDEKSKHLYRACEGADGLPVCANGGLCFSDDSNDTGFRCECPYGWTGETCQQDIDECVELSPCRHGGRCTNIIGGYSCACTAGWQGVNCTIPVNNCHDFRCLNGGTCSSELGSGQWRCSCPKGFSGRQCEFRTGPCRPNPCNGGVCQLLNDGSPASALKIDSFVGYQCTCPMGRSGRNCERTETGYKLQQTKLEYNSCLVAVRHPQSGQVDVLSTKICGPHGVCVSASEDQNTEIVAKPGEFRCECDLGYTGEACHMNINDCASSPCKNGGTCLDKVNSFKCACARGFAGELCEKTEDPCAGSLCGPGDCVGVGGEDYYCRCPPGLRGPHCNMTAVSQCEGSPCQNGGTCEELESSFICKCLPDFVGYRCQQRRQTPCEALPCQNGATCVNVDDDRYQCWCPDGFSGPLCEQNIDDCLGATCFHNATCVDGVNRFSCICPKGFSGADCRLDIDECSSAPCHGGGTCVDMVNDYFCLCPSGRTGRSCEVLVVQLVPSASLCVYNGLGHAVGTVWSEPKQCSICRCLDGGQVLCERRLCDTDECNPSDPDNSCLFTDQECVYTEAETCFSPPCRPHAECRPRPNPLTITPMIFSTHCGPRDASGCPAKLTLNFARNSEKELRATAIDGFTVESICAHVRRALSHQNAHQLAVGCVARSRTTLEVLLAPIQPGQEISAVVQAHHLGRVISEMRSNSSVLNAVAQLRVDGIVSTVPPGAQEATSIYLIYISLLLLLLLVMLILAYKMCPRRQSSLTKTYIDPSPVSLNNLRLPKVNNLSPYEETVINIDKTQNLEEEFAYNKNSYLLKRTPLDDLKIGKPVHIPQVPDAHGHDNGYAFSESTKNSSVRKGGDDVVWC